jgi:hypothetical protein
VNKTVSYCIRVTHPGPFKITLNLPVALGSADSFHIEMFSSRSYVPARIGSGADSRRLAFILKRIAIGFIQSTTDVNPGE